MGVSAEHFSTIRFIALIRLKTIKQYHTNTISAGQATSKSHVSAKAPQKSLLTDTACSGDRVKITAANETRHHKRPRT
jgi:hypothetical protein